MSNRSIRGLIDEASRVATDASNIAEEALNTKRLDSDDESILRSIIAANEELHLILEGMDRKQIQVAQGYLQTINEIKDRVREIESEEDVNINEELRSTPLPFNSVDSILDNMESHLESLEDSFRFKMEKGIDNIEDILDSATDPRQTSFIALLVNIVWLLIPGSIILGILSTAAIIAIAIGVVVIAVALIAIAAGIGSALESDAVPRIFRRRMKERFNLL